MAGKDMVFQPVVTGVLVLTALSKVPGSPELSEYMATLTLPEPLHLILNSETVLEDDAVNLPRTIYSAPQMPVIAASSAPMSLLIAVMVIERALVAVVARLSVTWTVKLGVPAEDGVPVIAPVDELRERPAGKEPAEMAHE